MPRQAGQITAQLPRQVEKYGVFVDAGFEQIVATVGVAGLTGVQLHRSPDAPFAGPAAAAFRPGNWGSCGWCTTRQQDFEQQLAGLERDEERVLVDSSSSRAVGGTGTYQLRLAGSAQQLRARGFASAVDCSRRAHPGECEAGNRHPEALGSRRSKRRGEYAWQEGSRAGAGLYPVSPGCRRSRNFIVRRGES